MITVSDNTSLKILQLSYIKDILKAFCLIVSLCFHVLMCNIPLLLFRLTFSFASTSDEASGGSGGQTAGLGQGNMLSEALQGKHESYSSEQKNVEFFMVINRLTKVLLEENFPFANITNYHFCKSSYQE